jgi:parvulin-like peptidyl-prolyl isomerase
VTLALVAICWSATTAAQPLKPPMNVVAKAGELFISEKEFLQRFELVPALQRSRKSRLEESKLELVYSLIAEKLLAQEARERRLDRDSSFLASFEDVRKLLARDQLYREEVQSKVKVSDQEVRQGIAEAQREILISFLFFDKEDDALFVRKQIKTERDFDRLRVDSSMRAVRDTATVIWSDAQPAIERVAYQLKKGEISRVVNAGSGYYILKVQRTATSTFYTSLQPSVLYERVLGKLRERKEEARLNDYVKEILKGRIGYSKAAPFKRLGLAIERAFSRAALSGKVALSNAMVQYIRGECSDVLKDTLAVAGDRMWTVADVLDLLYSKGFNVDSSSVKSLPASLNAQVKVWVQQELLAQEALHRGLDRYPNVRDQLDMWHESFLAQWMKLAIRKQISVSDAEAVSYLRRSDSAISVPFVRIRELKTSTLDDMQQALAELDKGKSLEEVIVRWCSDPELRQRKGISDPFPILEREPIGEMAWQMIPGQRYGPLKDSMGFVYFELLSKDIKGEGNDTALAARLSRARKDLFRMKEKRMVTLFLAQTGDTRGFDVYQDRLMKLEVSPVPMMTFRILGFGGRMFAVPFVDPQIEWLNVTPPSEKIVF